MVSRIFDFESRTTLADVNSVELMEKYIYFVIEELYSDKPFSQQEFQRDQNNNETADSDQSPDPTPRPLQS